MDPRTLNITTWAELFALPNFHQTPLDRTAMLQGHLVKPYDMSEKDGMRPCGIAQCATDHRHGWLVKLPDDTLAHVGVDCGKKHFHNWSQMTRTYHSQNRRRAREEALLATRQTLRELIGSTSYESADTRRARERLKIFDGLPDDVREAIQRRTVANDAVVPGQRLQTPSEVMHDRRNEGIKHPQPRMITYVRYLKGLPGIHRTNRVDHLLDVEFPALLRELTALADRDDATSKDLTEGTHRLDAFRRRVESSVRQLAAFFSADNIALLGDLRGVRSLGVERIMLVGEQIVVATPKAA